MCEPTVQTGAVGSGEGGRGPPPATRGAAPRPPPRIQVRCSDPKAGGGANTKAGQDRKGGPGMQRFKAGATVGRGSLRDWGFRIAVKVGAEYEDVHTRQLAHNHTITPTRTHTQALGTHPHGKSHGFERNHG